MAQCSFFNATDAINLSRNNTLIWTEICEIQKAILAAIDSNEKSVIVSSGTPFTTTGGISSVTVTAGGTNYDLTEATASVNANGTGGTGAVVTPIVTGQTITSFVIDAGGAGYTPVNATASLAAPSNLNDAQDETNYDGVGGDGTFTAGDDYFVGEVVTLSESSTATVDAITSTGVVTIAGQDETNFDNAGNNGTFTGGSGYLVADTITLSDGTVITVDTVSAGVITEFTVTSSSTSSRTSGLQRVQLNTSGSGVGFSLTTGTNNETSVGQVTQFTIASPGAAAFFLGSTLLQGSTTGIGTEFTITPSTNNVVGLPGGTGATLTPIVTNGVITNVVINTAGTGYISGTPVIISHPSGSTFTGNVSSVGGSGEVLAVTITNGGSGYQTVNALVAITHPTGFGFAGVVQTTGGVVTGISIQDGGSLFGPISPTASVTTSTGQDAMFQVNLINTPDGEVDSIDVLTGGFNYATGDTITIVPVTGDDGAGATATLTIDENTFGTDPNDYYLELVGQASDAVIASQIQFVLDYFNALGYNTRAQVNPATNNTIRWQIIW